MKNLKNIFLAIAAVCALAIGAVSCDLEEYNPSGATVDVLLSTPDGVTAFVNRLYYNYPWKYFGREDPVLYIESGTDIWVPRGGAENTYGNKMTMYDGVNAEVGQYATVWNRQYDNINKANAIINRIGAVDYGTNTAEKDYREGEARWFRAYAYWWLCEFFGGVEMRTEETSTAVFEAYRTDPDVIYDEVILPDLRIACEKLSVEPCDGVFGRHTRKAAYGLLARCALTRASYCSNAAEAQPFYKEAYDAAKYVMDNKAALGIKLYDTYDEVWMAKNNKNNTEFLARVTHSSNSTYNAQSGNPNRLFEYFSPKLQSFMGISAASTNWEYFKEQGASSAAQMPTRYFLELFEEGDMRYDIDFQEKFYAPSATEQPNWSFDWDSEAASASISAFKKDLAAIKAANNGVTKIERGELLYYFPRTSVDDEVQKGAKYVILDIDDRYNKDGGVKTAAEAGNANITRYGTPRFRKFRISDTPTPGATDAVLCINGNSNTGYADVTIMRYAEMQLIAAEAAMYLGTDNKGADFINDLRTRIVRPGYEKEMHVDASDMDIDFILDERARELCGEWLRWFDLHRTGQLIKRVKAHNPQAGAHIIDAYNYRAIPSAFLKTLTNAKEFGQNPGYSTE